MKPRQALWGQDLNSELGYLIWGNPLEALESGPIYERVEIGVPSSREGSSSRT